jgi:ABC-type nickel/cobalt efflux system permease component RcnA
MGAMMYRQRPNLPALIAAGICLVGGVLLMCGLQQKSGVGATCSAPLAAVAFLTSVLTGTFLIIAFARYRFTHLWKSTGASHSDKYKDQHKKHHRNHRHHTHR